MAVPTDTDAPPVEWRVDARTSPVLRLVSHGFVAALGGSLLLALGVAVVVLPGVPPALGPGALLLVALLVLVGGPLSLLYLWPMLADPDQRPGAAALTGGEERTPWTARSIAVAATAGAVLLVGVAAAGAPFGRAFDLVTAAVVAGLFSPVLVALFTTDGAVDGDRLVCNGTAVPLRQVTRVRTVRVGAVVLFWLSHAPRTGLRAPRLVTVPAGKSAAVASALERGTALSPEGSTPDPLVRAVVGSVGLLFLGAAVLAWWAVDEPAVRLYVGVVFGLLGGTLCVVGWRGV